MEAVELEFKQEEAQCGASSRADVDEASAAFLRATKKLLFLGSAVCRDDASLQRAGRIAAATGGNKVLDAHILIRLLSHVD